MSKIQELLELRIKTHANKRDTDRLMEYLVETDFYRAPASSNPAYHAARRGGLAEHTLNVIDLVLAESILLGRKDLNESGVLAAVCHDLCKVNFYVEDGEPPTGPQLNFLNTLARKNGYGIMELDTKSKANCSLVIDWLKNDPSKEKPELADEAWMIRDSFPFGHGEKSALLAAGLIELTDEELCAIRFHMGFYDRGIAGDHGTNKAFEEARRLYPLVDVLIVSDQRAVLHERWRV